MPKGFLAGLLAGTAVVIIAAAGASVFLLPPVWNPVPPAVPILVPENRAKAMQHEPSPVPPQGQAAPRPEAGVGPTGHLDPQSQLPEADQPPPEPMTSAPKGLQSVAEQTAPVARRETPPTSPQGSPPPAPGAAPAMTTDHAAEPLASSTQPKPEPAPAEVSPPHPALTSRADEGVARPTQGFAPTSPSPEEKPVLWIILLPEQAGAETVPSSAVPEADSGGADTRPGKVLIIDEETSIEEFRNGLATGQIAAILDAGGRLRQNAEMAALASSVAIIGPPEDSAARELREISQADSLRQVSDTLNRAAYQAAQRGEAFVIAPATVDVQNAVASWRGSAMGQRVQIAAYFGIVTGP